MTETQQYTATLVIVRCGECELSFGMSEAFYNERKRDHQAWYCPAGHPRIFTDKSDVEKARDRAAQLERRLANRDEDLRAERASHRVTEHRRRAAKGQLTKTKKRVANGVCPCCNRSFADLGRHMAGQHPDYAESSHS